MCVTFSAFWLRHCFAADTHEVEIKMNALANIKAFLHHMHVKHIAIALSIYDKCKKRFLSRWVHFHFTQLVKVLKNTIFVYNTK